MKLAYVEIAGFRGFKEKTRFDLDPGFAVITGRNGVGKSSFFDAIDFALTGSINKYRVKGAKGGGLESHIWWIGEGTPQERYVSVGFVDANGEVSIVRRSREHGLETPEQNISSRLCTSMEISGDWAQTLMQTSLIRDEMIAALSLDLSEQERFSAVQAAMGSLKGSDHSERTKALLKAAEAAKNEQELRVNGLQADLGRALGALTEVQSSATNSSEIVEAERLVTAVLGTPLPVGSDGVERLRTIIAERRRSITPLQEAAVEAESIQADILYFESAEGQSEIHTSMTELETIANARVDAVKRVSIAEALFDSEREQDSLTVHLSALLEHGEAVGLIEGHCPLCEALRDTGAFASALVALRTRLAERGERVRLASSELSNAKKLLADADSSLEIARQRNESLASRQAVLAERQKAIANVIARWGVSSPSLDAMAIRESILSCQEATATLEQALSMLEASSANDRISTFQARVNNLREAVNVELAKLNSCGRALELTRQIENAGKVVANELLAEQFDTVLPLLKELYLRLRPHSEWREIETDIAGHVRASLNFTVGDGKNPQFLFSSGQRRAAGIAFLLAIYLSRPWCAFQTLGVTQIRP